MGTMRWSRLEWTNCLRGWNDLQGEWDLVLSMLVSLGRVCEDGAWKVRVGEGCWELMVSCVERCEYGYLIQTS